jgi:SOS-response transcriptional repressor LexA
LPISQALTKASVQLASCAVAAGFPSPADDYLELPLDFYELLIQNPEATFVVRIAGESMTGARLLPGDIAVVNRALTPVNQHSAAVLIKFHVLHPPSLPKSRGLAGLAPF